MKFAFVFPGQGSQSVGMMAGYGDAAPVRETFAEAADALGQDLWIMASDGPAACSRAPAPRNRPEPMAPPMAIICTCRLLSAFW